MASWDVTTANDPLEFDTVLGRYNSCFKIDDNHFINFWGGNGDDGFVQVFAVDTSTWAVTTANSSIEFDTQNGTYNSCYQIDSNHFINFWQGASGDGFVEAFAVNTSTWAVTTAGARLEFDTRNSYTNSCCQIDSNHFINFWGGAALVTGRAQIIGVNTSTWDVATANGPLSFDTATTFYISCCKVDDNHVITFWGSGNSRGLVQAFAVNTSTWEVTTANSSLEFNAGGAQHHSCFKVDDNHFINFWGNSALQSIVQVFTVNTSTWVVTTANDPLEIGSADRGLWNTCYQVDSNHFINFRSDIDSDGRVQVITVDTSTWAVTVEGASLEFDTVSGQYNSCFKVDDSHFINFWAGNGDDGFVQVFTVALPGAGPSFLPAWARNSNSILKVM